MQGPARPLGVLNGSSGVRGTGSPGDGRQAGTGGAKLVTGEFEPYVRAGSRPRPGRAGFPLASRTAGGFFVSGTEPWTTTSPSQSSGNGSRPGKRPAPS